MVWLVSFYTPVPPNVLRLTWLVRLSYYSSWVQVPTYSEIEGWVTSADGQISSLVELSVWIEVRPLVLATPLCLSLLPSPCSQFPSANCCHIWYFLGWSRTWKQDVCLFLVGCWLSGHFLLYALFWYFSWLEATWICVADRSPISLAIASLSVIELIPPLNLMQKNWIMVWYWALYL